MPRPTVANVQRLRILAVTLLSSLAVLSSAATVWGQDTSEANQPLADAEMPEPIRADVGMIESDGPDELGPPRSSVLTVADVIASVYRSYPEINQARQESQIAAGNLTAAYGAFDTKLQAFTLSEPTGFYRNYRHGIGVARQTWWGGNVAAGYRLGRGVFQPWYLERETEKGGEFKVAFSQALLQGRAIDPSRVAVFRASLSQQAADPILQQAILTTSRDAAISYWDWVAAGESLSAQEGLLQLAELRGEQFTAGFEAGKFAEIDVVLNRQLIAERRAKRIDAEQKYQVTALKLSLYLRDDSGQPLLPSQQWRPTVFPQISPLPATNMESEISLAVDRRPEPRRLQIELRQLNLDRRLAGNQMLPQLDLVVEGSQDVGLPGSSSDDKGEFVLVIGAASEVPIQRRKARGELFATSAKIAQLSEELRLQRDRIAVELRTAYTRLQFTAQRVEQTELAFQTALDTLKRFRFAFDQGKVDLIYLNFLETKTNETELELIEAQKSWFQELAVYQAAAGLDPLDQATLLSELPDANELRTDNIDAEGGPDNEN